MYSIYKHTTPSGKIYIGLTSKEDPNDRWRNGSAYSKNEHFRNAIRKYGWDNIKHEVLEAGLTRDQASEAEKKYISMFESHKPTKGYNLTEGGEKGVVFTEESRKKLSQSRTGQRYNIGVPFTEERKAKLRGPRPKIAGSNNPRYGKKVPAEELERRQAHRIYATGGENPCARPILQLDKDGNLVKRWGSIAEAAEIYCRTSIKDVLRGKYKQHRGFIWKYEE